jgi:hypothetical protein
MRMGKTLMTIWARQKKGDKRILVITAGKSTLIPWCHALTEQGEVFIPNYDNPKVRSLNVKDRSLSAELLFDIEPNRRIWCLMNCEAVLAGAPVSTRNGKRHYGIPDIAKLPWDCVVIDESVCIANPQANLTKVCCDGFREAKSRGILSGLPAPESELQLFSQFKFLDGEAFGWKSFWGWRAANFFQNERNDWIPQKGVAKAIKDYLHTRAFIISREDVGIGSRKLYESRYVAMPPALRKIYNRVLKEFAYGEKETNFEVVVQTWLARICGGFDPEGKLVSTHKINELYSLLDNELRNEQVVVWFRFDAEIQTAASYFPEALVITGDVPFDERKKKNEVFLARRNRLMFCQAMCAKRGLDFSSADTAIYYSNWWSADTREQSEDRIINPGKNNPQLIVDLITEQSVDGKVVESLRNKTFNAKILMRDLREEFAR